MSRWSPCKRSIFIRKLRKLNFDGPFSGGRHQFMTLKNCRLAIPSNDEYSIPQLHVMIKEVEKIVGKEISSEAWDALL